MKVISNW